MRTRILTVLAVLGLLAGCGASPAGQPSSPSSSTSGLHADRLATPIAAPALTLTGTDGRPYDFRARTAGRVTLLYFGYTHCPDVCPTTMADIAMALRSVPVQVRQHTTVVFVTSDPHRDTPGVIRSWLAAFDRSFIGLTGPQKTIYAAADKVNVPLEAPRREADGSYSVSHGAEVLAFGPDGKARVVFTSGTSSADYAHDLTLIAQNQI